MSIVKKINYRLSHLFYFFIVYSFIGWCLETVYMSLNKGMFINRGFLFGPFLPIYGFGALIMLFIMKPLGKNIFYLFIGGIFFLSLFEYITGFVFENFFGRLLWDYSNKPLNINGHVWIGASLIWGALGTLLIVKVHPYIEYLYRLIPSSAKSIATGFLITYLIFDITAASALSLGLGDRVIQVFQTLRESGLLTNRLEKTAAIVKSGAKTVMESIRIGFPKGIIVLIHQLLCRNRMV